MKRVLIFVIIGFVFLSTVQAQTDKPLKKGMPNTVTLSTGEVVYDLNGEWATSYKNDYFGTQKGIVKITQEGSKFVGVSLTENGFASNGGEIIKGELEKVGFKTVSTYYKNADWFASTGEIGEKCNKIEIRMKTSGGEVGTLITLTRK